MCKAWLIAALRLEPWAANVELGDKLGPGTNPTARLYATHHATRGTARPGPCQADVSVRFGSAAAVLLVTWFVDIRRYF